MYQHYTFTISVSLKISEEFFKCQWIYQGLFFQALKSKLKMSKFNLSILQLCPGMADSYPHL